MKSHSVTFLPLWVGKWTKILFLSSASFKICKIFKIEGEMFLFSPCPILPIHYVCAQLLYVCKFFFLIIMIR